MDCRAAAAAIGIVTALLSASCSKSKDRPPPVHRDDPGFDGTAASDASRSSPRCESGDESPSEGRFDAKKVYVLGRVAGAPVGSCNTALVAADDWSKGLASVCGADDATIRPTDGALIWTRYGNIYRWVPDGWDGTPGSLPASPEDNDVLLASCGSQVELWMNPENGTLVYFCGSGGLHWYELPAESVDGGTQPEINVPSDYFFAGPGYGGTYLLQVSPMGYAIYARATDSIIRITGVSPYFSALATRAFSTGYFLSDGNYYVADFTGKAELQGGMWDYEFPEAVHLKRCEVDGCQSMVCTFGKESDGGDQNDSSVDYVVKYPRSLTPEAMHIRGESDVIEGLRAHLIGAF